MASHNSHNFEVCNLSLEHPENTNILIRSVWYEKSFSVTLFDGTNTWSGEMNSDSSTVLSDQLGLTLNEYIDQCRRALCTNDGDKGFIYTFKDDIFQWKKHSMDMKITFGQLCMEKTPVIDTLHCIINDVLTENSFLKKKVNKFKEEKINLEADNKHLIETLEDCNNLKSRMENDLFKQFLKVLNTKKEKINELKKHTSYKSREEKPADEIASKYECDTDVDSDSDEDCDEDNIGRNTEKDESDRFSDNSDSEEKLNKHLLLPRRNRSATTQETSSNRTVGIRKPTNQITDDGQGPSNIQQTRRQSGESNEHPISFTREQTVPSSSLLKRSRRNFAVSFVDKDEEIDKNGTFFEDDEDTSILGNNFENHNSNLIIQSPKKHELFRNQLAENLSSTKCSESGASAPKILKIENNSTVDKSDLSAKVSNCIENSQIQTSVTVNDLIDRLLS